MTPPSLPRRPLLALTVLAAGSARAFAAGEPKVVTEYPATAMPGEGVTAFTAAANERGLGLVAGTDGPDGYRSAAAFRVLSEGRAVVADAFAGALAPTDPLFLLSSLPFLTASQADAAKLRDLARPHYAAKAVEHGGVLLWTTPWPPSGLWTRRPVTTPADLRGLRIRTYDATGTAVLRAAGAEAEVLSYGAVMERLAAGTLDAVLSSGDGGAGRQLWRWLPNFTEVNYAWPLSLAFASRSWHSTLATAQQEAVMAAAAATEARQWQAIEGRLAANRRRMEENSVAIHAAGPELLAALRQAARGASAEWLSQTGETGRRILSAYEA